jgi:geranylgeranyl pyrophosphate synthase
LDEVEALLREVVPRDVPMVGDIYQGMLDGGKRLRPALLLLSAAAFRPLVGPERAACRAAAAVELVHLASLLHDDLVDRSATRRGQMTALRRFGAAPSVLTGDYLAACAYRRLSLHSHPKAMTLLADAVAGMCEAELVVLSRGREPMDARAYLAVAAGKTGSLLRSACEMGAIEGGADLVGSQTVGAYGRDLGIAFQIVDDLLDLYGDPASTGKPVGQDILAGQPNLPVILAAENDPDGRLVRLLAELADSEQATEEMLVVARGLVEELGGRQAARETAERYALTASHRLTQLPETPAATGLAEACRYVLDRSK